MSPGKDRPAATCFALLLLVVMETRANRFDPHLFPSRGPFFEGWYVRLIDHSQRVSIGFLFGRVLPQESNNSLDSSESTDPLSGAKESLESGYDGQGQCDPADTLCDSSLPLVVASILVWNRNVSTKLLPHSGAFKESDFVVTVKDGKPVTHDPDDRSPADFAIKFGPHNGSFIVTGAKSVVDVSVGNERLWVESSNPVPWGPDGEGPEGWLEHLPLPLHWFVYSLGSMVTGYKWTDEGSGRCLSGTNARLHMEKNWGKSFPQSWIWAQGLTETNVTLSLSGGPVDFEVISVTAFLVGYRNPDKDIVWNFTPANSIVSFKHSGCEGAVSLNVTSLEHRLALRITSPVHSFSDCLLGPEKKGFRPACVESYDALASVRAYKQHDFGFVEIDRTEIDFAALEFGGKYVCDNECSHETTVGYVEVK